jgi:Sulfotransferase family
MMAKQIDTPFFFIIGRPRSGTTLLRLLLEAHPNVIIPPESPIIINLYKKYRHISNWAQSDILSLIEDLKKQMYFETWLMKDEDLKDKLLECTGENSFYNILKTIYLTYPSVFPKEKIKLIGDKNPAYSLYLNRIHKLYPNSKFIYISRDYRDNYLSLIRVNFEIPLVPLVVFRWKFAYRQFKKLQKKSPQTFYDLKYEDLATEPKVHYKKVCDFLGLDFREDVFDFYKKEKEMKGAYGDSKELLDIHQSLFNPINTSRINTWKKKMSDKEIRMADFVAGETADELGYERKYKKFSLLMFFRTLPSRIYGRLMYTMMLWGERLPLKIRNMLLEFLGVFLKMYWSLNKKKFNQKKA